MLEGVESVIGCFWVLVVFLSVDECYWFFFSVFMCWTMLKWFPVFLGVERVFSKFHRVFFQ